MRLSICGAVATLSFSPLCAQEGVLDLFQFEKNYVARGTPTVLGAPAYYAGQEEPSLLAEAQFIGKFALYRGLTFPELRDGSGRGFNLYITTQFRLRGLNTQSGPVRSPSFMPRIVGQYLWAYMPNSDSEEGRRVSAVYLALGHHSNGGDGCVFSDQVVNAKGKCVSSLASETPASEREVRLRGGNFTTNYLEVGAAHRWGRVVDDPVDHWKWAVDATLSTQVHHRISFPLPGGAEKAFGELYGIVRPRLDVAGHHLVHKTLALRWWTSIEGFTPAEERFPGSRNHRVQTELTLQIPSRSNAPELWRRTLGLVGLGARHVRGQDYYNTLFIRDVSNLQLLLTVDPWNPWFSR